MSEHSPSEGISIWFFIGGLLAIYGVLILGAGIDQVWHPPQPPVVLQRLHAGIWWGALLLVGGVIYLVMFRPGRQRGRAGKATASVAPISQKTHSR